MAIETEETLQQDPLVGQPAPDFTLEDENEQQVTLSALRGNPVVLVFYPFDWSGLCTAELCTLRDNYSSFQQLGAQVYGISRDSVYSHAAWKKHMNYEYSLLADLDGSVARLYDAWNEERHRAERTTIVIDGEGIVRYVVRNFIGTPRDHVGALAALKEISGAAL